MVCIRHFDKVNEGVFSYISTLKLWKNPHFHTEKVDVMWTLHISKLKMWMGCGGMCMFCGAM